MGAGDRLLTANDHSRQGRIWQRSRGAVNGQAGGVARRASRARAAQAVGLGPRCRGRNGLRSAGGLASAPRAAGRAGRGIGRGPVESRALTERNRGWVHRDRDKSSRSCRHNAKTIVQSIRYVDVS